MSRIQIPTVLFNASVILAGLKSPSGGSGKLFLFLKQSKIKGIISEPILDEILRNTDKIGQSKSKIVKILPKLFKIHSPPKKETVRKFGEVVIYFGDAHVLASSYEAKVKFLVSLDQKHILALKDIVKDFKIVTPGQLIEYLEPHIQ